MPSASSSNPTAASLGKQLDELRNTLAERRENPLEKYTRDPAAMMRDAGLTPDPWQTRLLKSKAKRILLCCARQVGKSTGTAMLALHEALTVPRSTTTIIAPSENQSNELLRKVTQGFNALGRPLGIVSEAVTSLEFSNGSRVLARPGKERSIRGWTNDLLIVDEAARVPDDVFMGAAPTLSVSGGRLVVLSTAFAKSGWFYTEWTGDDASYLRLSITAYDCPRHSKEFLNSERKKLGDRWFNMEYLNVFGDDVAAVFRSEDIARAFTTDFTPLEDFDRADASDFTPDVVAHGFMPLEDF